MEENKTTTTTTEEQEVSPQEEQQENKEQSSEESKNDEFTKIVDALLTPIFSKIDGVTTMMENRFIALADDVHQRLDRQDDTIVTKEALKKEGVF